jgi:membrane protease YdiL (CAAX protease family)
MRYFRAYPWGVQLFFLITLWFVLAGAAGSIIPAIIPRLTGFSLLQIQDITPDSPPALIQAAIIIQGLFQLFTYFLSAFLFAYLAHPSPSEYLGLRAPGKKIQWLLVALVMIGAIPVLELLDGLMSLINFGPKIKAMQEQNDKIAGAFLKMPSTMSFIRSFVVIAIIPPLGEEMFFRGVLMRFAKKRTRTMVFPIIFSAVIFALAHANVYGLPSIFMAGILLAVIYNLTGSLWCSILAHFLFNGLQIILIFASNYIPVLKTVGSDTNMVPVSLAAAGLVVFLVSFYLLLKNKTPLPPNWTDDYAPEELPDFDFGEKK